MARKHRFESEDLKFTYNRYLSDDPKAKSAFEEEYENVKIARKIYDLRTAEGLTQKDLATKVGTTPSVISRLEDSDYDGHSLSMLRRICKALNQRLEVRFAPKEAKK